jgi:hypothetical protein
MKFSNAVSSSRRKSRKVREEEAANEWRTAARAISGSLQQSAESAAEQWEAAAYTPPAQAGGGLGVF